MAKKKPFAITASSADVKKLIYIYIYKILNVMYMCSYEAATLRNLNLELVFASDTIENLRNYVRVAYAEYFLKHSIVIGGERHMVEIDESLFARRKFNIKYNIYEIEG